MSGGSTSGAGLLIKNAAIVTVDAQLGDFARGDILVDDAVITAIGRDLAPQTTSTATVIDGRGMIAFPGFVDSHIHAWEGQLRGQGPALDFGALMHLTAGQLGPRYRPQDNYTGTLLTALKALDSGITTLVDNSHNARTPEHAQAAVEALVDAGIRGVHAIGSPFGTALGHILSTATALRNKYAGGLIGIRLFAVHPTEQVWQFAKDEEFWVSTELGSHTPDLEDLFEQLGRHDLLTPQHAYNHCYDLSDRVWQLIGDSGAAVNLAPRSSGAFGLGSTVPPVDKALSYAAAVGLSNDNELSYGLNMFAEMQALSLRYRSERFRQRHAGGDDLGPDPLTPARLLQMATAGGAANAGLAGQIGSLTPGKQADIVLVRAGDMCTMSSADPAATLATIAHPGSVDTVLVAGRIRKQDGRLLDVDLDNLRRRQRESYEHVASSRSS